MLRRLEIQDWPGSWGGCRTEEELEIDTDTQILPQLTF